MKLSKKAIAGIGAGVVLLLLVCTVPNKDDHKQAIAKECLASMEKESKTEKEQMEAALGASMIGKVLDSSLEVSNYGIVSVGRISNGKESKTVSYGVLGHVFVSNMDEKTLEDSAKK